MTLAGRTWADVRQELFGEPYMVWHDGPDFGLLREAWVREPEALIEQLFQGMSEGDALAAQSLSELEPAPTGAQRDRVIGALEKHVHDSPAGAQVQLGLTLYKLTGDAAWTAPIVRVLDSDEHWGNRIDAAIALRQVPATPELRDVLLRNIQADDYLVRYHSAETLWRWAGKKGEVDKDDYVFSRIATDDAPTKWAEAAERLCNT